MLQITAAQMRMFEDRAWAETARSLPAELGTLAHDDSALAAQLAARSLEEREAIASDAIATARDAGFRWRHEVTALARLFFSHGQGIDRSPLASRVLEPLERIAVMRELASADSIR